MQNMHNEAKNVFVLGLDEFHRAQLESLRRASEYRFHELCSRAEVRPGREDVAERVLGIARERLSRSSGRVDAIVGYWDFPTSTMLPLLRREAGVATASFEAVLACEHKYWSRLEQARIVPEHVPHFCAVDPMLDDVRGQITLAYPYWLKPVKSVLSYLGFKVHDDGELRDAIVRIRDGIACIATPFDHLLGFADLPDEIAHIGGRHCIAESIISKGRQCTLEGYAHDGEIHIYGAIDSLREGRHASSFSRYQYPSSLPEGVLHTMADIARRFLTHIGFDDSPFNIEFYLDEDDGSISLLEVNPRISRSHCSLFKMVDGEYHHQVMIDVALGRRPHFPHREGEHRLAAKFMWRAHGDGTVSRVPTARELAALRDVLPSAEVELHVTEGTRLSELAFQDSYSFELASIFLGGDSEAQLLEHYQTCREMLGLRVDDI